MCKVKKKNNYAIYIFLLIGVFLIGVGIFSITATSGVETIGTFTESIEHRGNRYEGAYYIWQYKFMVDEQEYILLSNPKQSAYPKKNEDIILYNPRNPNQARLKSDNAGTMVIIAGLVVASVPFFFNNKNSKDELLSEEEKKKRKDKKAAIFMIFFCCSILFMMLLDVSFNITRLLLEKLFPLIIVVLFLIIGVFMFVKANNTNDTISKK